MLTIEGLSIYRNSNQILSDISLSLFPRSMLRVTGTNGIGKTSFLRSVAGLLPYKGKIEFNMLEDNNISHMCSVLEFDEPRKAIESSICYVGHSDSLHEDMVVIDYINYIAHIYDNGYAILSTIRFLELGKYIYYKIGELSAGTRKRLGIAKLLISNRRIWIIDEPFANLDDYFRDKIKNLFHVRIAQDGIIIIADHFENLEHKELNKFTVDLPLNPFTL